MGACNSAPVTGSALQKSVAHYLVPESEWKAFEELWTVESCSISKPQPMRQRDAMYVVLSGELHVIAEKPAKCKEDSVTVQVFREGDLIHMFNNAIRSNEGLIACDGMQLSLMPKLSEDGKAVTVASLTDANMKSFLAKSRDNEKSIQALKWFSNLKLPTLLANQEFVKGMSNEQIEMLSPMMKMLIARDGDVLQFESLVHPIPEPLLQRNPSIKRGQSVVEVSVRRTGSIDLASAAKSTHVLLGGQCLSLHEDTTFEDYKKLAMKSFRPQPAEGVSFRREMSDRIKNTLTKPTIASFISRFQPFKAAPIVPGGIMESLGDIIQPGSVFGIENHFLKGSERCFENIMASADSVLGILNDEAFVAMKKLMSNNMYKQLNANFNMYLFSFLNDLPLFKDLSLADFEHLSQYVQPKIVQPDEVIFRQGDEPHSMFVVMQGAVCEFSDKLKKEHVLEPGQSFGEVAIVTDTHYHSTAKAKELSVLLSIDKKTFRAVFDRDKSKSAERKIRLLGENVELEYLLGHPKGYSLFVDFSDKEHASEAILFWYAVDRFDDMYSRIMKAYKATIDPSFSEASLRDPPPAAKSAESSVRGSVRKPRHVTHHSANHNTWKVLESNVKELHDVCKAIIDKFIIDGAVQQVNIPGKMRVEVEKLYRDWKNIPTVKQLDKLEEERLSTKDAAANVVESAMNGQSHDPAKQNPSLVETKLVETNVRAVLDSDIFARVQDIFKRPKKEAYELLKKDTYVRLKLTQEFTDFIAAVMKGGSEKIENSSKLSRSGKLVGRNSVNRTAQ